MNELIPVNSEKEIPTVSARDLYEFLGHDPGNYSRWTQQNITNNPYATENADYSVFFSQEENPLGGRPTTDYALTLEFSKKLCMISKSKKGEEIRDYFIEVEKEYAKQKHDLPTDYLSALKALVAAEESKIQLSAENKQLKEEKEIQGRKIAEITPLAEYASNILKSPSGVNINAIAKDYGMSGTAMNKLLHGLGIQYCQDGQWLLYAKHQDKGYTRSQTIPIKLSDGRTGSRLHTQWTQEGRLYLYETLKAHGVLPVMERAAPRQISFMEAN